MAVLVTGGAGYIGSHMVLELLDRGEDVIVIDDLSNGREEAVDPRAALVVASCGNDAAVEAAMYRHGVDAVLHFAGSIVVPESVSHPLEYYSNNTLNSHALMQSCLRHGVKHFVFSSTAAVYGDGSGRPLTENAPARPSSPYGSSKLMTETMLGDVEKAHGMRHAILRYFNVCGADPAMRAGQTGRGSTHLFKVACEAATGKRPFLEVYGTDWPTPDGTCVRDYVHVSDLVQAHYLALRRLREGSRSILANCGYGRGSSVREVVAAVEAASGRSLDVREAPRRAGDPAALVSDPARARDGLGWEPRYCDLETMARHALEWERRLGDLNRAA